MEYVAHKKSVRKWKRNNKNKQKRRIVKSEVRKAKRRKLKIEKSCLPGKEQLHSLTSFGAMEAQTFWENYNTAQEWQQRHNVTWWRTRCAALEQENQVLREKLRSLVKSDLSAIGAGSSDHSRGRGNRADEVGEPIAVECAEEEEDSAGRRSVPEDEALEFQINEELMSFLEQSARHKMELREKREGIATNSTGMRESDDATGSGGEALIVEGGAAAMRLKSKGAKLLYGEASSRILAMEAALQATVDRHKDKAKPQYWPNIPLKP